MFASASNGNQPNNRKFSPCSRRMMGGILVREGQDSTCEYVCVKDFVDFESSGYDVQTSAWS